MALKDTWVDRKNNEDYVLADDINSVAHAVIDIENAKESGEFDGQDGVGIASVKQTAGSNNSGGKNVVTVTLSNGEKSTFEFYNGASGEDGNDGKSAYAYAKEGGYTGTEEDFAVKLADESGGIHIGTDEPTDGSDVWIDTDEENAESSTDFPSTLPNPYALTINGISYDGSKAVDITVTGGDVTDGDVETETVLSDNLFDKTTAIIGKYWYNGNSSVSLMDADNTIFCAYVPLRGAGTYRTVIWWSHAGEDLSAKVPLLKEDNSFFGYATGTLTKIDNTFGYFEFVVTADMVERGAAIYAFNGANFGDYGLSKVMIVKNREYPSSYIPYGYIEVVVGGGSTSGGHNVLSGKTAVFLGDSICAGTTTLTDAIEYGYGWGGLIGSANNMKWKNFGENGGTVTALSDVGTALWLKTQATTAKSQYPDTDYVIFEGGCNDGDKMGTSGLGTVSADFSTFDESKFSGAFEALILQLLTDFPYAKIGYVIPPKMGIYNTDFSSRIYATYFDRAKEICKKWGVPFVDLWNENPLNPCLPMHLDMSLSKDEANRAGKFYVDGQHLTLAGYKRISPQIEAWMRTL